MQQERTSLVITSRTYSAARRKEKPGVMSSWRVALMILHTLRNLLKDGKSKTSHQLPRKLPLEEIVSSLWAFAVFK